MKRSAPICVLTIAGSDSGAGAGIQADARTIGTLGAYALTAITAITAQNKRGVIAWKAVSPALVAAQIDAVMMDFKAAAIKTGLLSGSAIVRAVARALARKPRTPLVIDPVIGSTTGTRFLSASGLRALIQELLPQGTLITPNWPEASVLSGRPVTNNAEAADAARRILALSAGRCAVLVKGGHASGNVCRDVLLTSDGEMNTFEGRRISTHNTHGTGCVLSAAIATRLAYGDDLKTAIQKAHHFLHRQLVTGKRLDWGGGAGPAFPGETFLGQ